jgi:uncharacterized membrane protein
VYAQIQADPLVARAAGLLAEATTTQRLLARAVMTGESTDPATWRTIFPTLFGFVPVLIAIAVVYTPEWVRSFDDRLYLRR